MREEIEWSEPSFRDIENIVLFIAKDSLFHADNFIENLFIKIKTLIEFPNLGKKLPEIKDKNIKELIFGNYRIIYKINSKNILILRIIHSVRDFKFKSN